MGVFQFDSGALFAVMPSLSNTPVKFGSLQGITGELNYSLEGTPLNMTMDIAKAIKKFSLKFKAKTAQLSGALINQLFFGQAQSSGSQNLARDLAGTIPSSPGPYTITPAVPNSGIWAQDLGVQYNSNGLPFAKVAMSPAQGQYSVTAGTYTFNSVDAGQAVVFNFLYSVTTGFSLSVANKFKAEPPYFQAILVNQYDGKWSCWNLNRCASNQLTLSSKVDEFSIPDFGFESMADRTPPLGVLGTLSFSE